MTTSSHNYISDRCIYTAEGVKILNDFDYLNHLLESTDEIVKSHNQQAIKSLRWDFQELKGSSTLSSFYQFRQNGRVKRKGSWQKQGGKRVKPTPPQRKRRLHYDLVE